jgi:poly(hydroxyalkanoate) depolymerase family esterase
MTDDFVAEILRATDTLRSGDPSGATAIIQAALAAGGLAPSPSDPKTSEAAPRISPRADIQTIEHTATPGGPDRARERLSPRGCGHATRPRRPLGEVLRTLAKGRKAIGREGTPPGSRPRPFTKDLPLPDGAEFHQRHFSCAAGARRYRLYVPASAEQGLEGLIVMLHGCTQSPEDFAAGTGMNALAEKHRLLVVYPAQTNANNSMSCWNWFRPGDQMRDAGEPAIIAGLTKCVRDEFVVRHDRVFVAGLSAGGAMAAIMRETYPDLYAGIGIHSGLAYGSASDVVSAFGAMRGQSSIETVRRTSKGPRPRMVVFHGSADTTVHPANADRIVAREDGSVERTFRSEQHSMGGKRGYSKVSVKEADGTHALECWVIYGAQHAWSGGSPAGTYTDPLGPDASAAMVSFFLTGRGEATTI